jgi:hypothetical protein
MTFYRDMDHPILGKFFWERRARKRSISWIQLMWGWARLYIVFALARRLSVQSKLSSMQSQVYFCARVGVLRLDIGRDSRRRNGEGECGD